MNFLYFLKKSSLAKLLIAIYIALFVFWVVIQVFGSREEFANNLFGALYPIISFVGGTYGIVVVSKQWGGMKSLMGRGVIFLSLGLLAEVFGQWAWSYFVIIKGIEVPYPSIADIGYFAIVPLYIYAIYNIAKASGISFGLRSLRGKFQVVVIPLVMIAIAYGLFIKDVEVDLLSPVRIFLDFGYPAFEVVAISMTILTYSLSREVLDGLMRHKVLMIIFALVAQYITDYTFLYRAGIGVYYNGGPVDLMYATSFLMMSLAVLYLQYPKENIKDKSF